MSRGGRRAFDSDDRGVLWDIAERPGRSSVRRACAGLPRQVLWDAFGIEAKASCRRAWKIYRRCDRGRILRAGEDLSGLQTFVTDAVGSGKKTCEGPKWLFGRSVMRVLRRWLPTAARGWHSGCFCGPRLSAETDARGADDNLPQERDSSAGKVNGHE